MGKRSCRCQHRENEAATAFLDGSDPSQLHCPVHWGWLRVTAKGWGLVPCWCGERGIGATTQGCTDPRPPALKGGMFPALLPHSFLSKEKKGQETTFSGN